MVCRIFRLGERTMPQLVSWTTNFAPPRILRDCSIVKFVSRTEMFIPSNGVMLNISAVERETGLSKDVLRMWERRYGFPDPGRDGNAERQYPPYQIAKLRAIKRLMDTGMRPGKLMNRSLDELNVLADTRAGPRREAAAPTLERDVLSMVRS